MRSIFFAALLLPTLACDLGQAGSPDGEDNTDDPSDMLSGRYEVTTHYDLSEATGFSGVIGPLAELRDDPAKTILSILEDTDDTVADILDLLPSSLRSQLEDSINNYVNEQIAAGGAAGDIVKWVDQVATILSNFNVVSTFEMGRATNGAASGDHSLAAIRFEVDGAVREVPITEIVSVLTIARGVRCEISDDGRMSIAEHAFHLPLGQLAVVGFNQILTSSLGAKNLNEALALAIDCNEIADSIGELCLGPVCISQSKIADVCSGGIDAVASEVESQIAKIDFTELRLSGGQAVLEDVKADASGGQIDQWAGGTWETALAIDDFRIPISAEFTATRM